MQGHTLPAVLSPQLQAVGISKGGGGGILTILSNVLNQMVQTSEHMKNVIEAPCLVFSNLPQII